MIKILFIILLIITFYTYLGYGILLFIIVKIKRLFSHFIESTTTEEKQEVTLLIAAYNEEAVIIEKMKNCNELNYPKDKLKIVWVTDGSNDKTNDLLKQYDNITILYQLERKGKTAALNRAMDYIDTPITVFTDANTFINSEAINEIIKCFQNEKVGCVAGEKRINKNSNGNSAANNEGIYWKYESTLKKLDYELYSTVGAAGELYAIRTSLFEKMPANTLLDDFILSMRITMKGYIIAYCDKAYATENGSANIIEEGKRKVRIAAGGIQSIYMLKPLLNILKFKTLSFQYISHRVLRWSITPISMFLMIPLNVYLVIFNNNIIYDIILYFQIIFYICGVLGWYTSKTSQKNKYLSIPYYFLFMNINVIKGFFYLINKKKNDGTWEKSLRS